MAADPAAVTMPWCSRHLRRVPRHSGDLHQKTLVSRPTPATAANQAPRVTVGNPFPPATGRRPATLRRGLAMAHRLRRRSRPSAGSAWPPSG
jgi:hypothetical protein